MVALTHNIALANDSEMERRIRIFLSAQSRQALRTVEVDAEGGVVTLRGRVHSYYEKQLSISLAARVAGVLRLEDKLHVQAIPKAS